jgi:hypothetical protein
MVFEGMGKFSEPCVQCGFNYWHVPGGGNAGWCSRCWVHWTASQTRARLAVITTTLPWQPCIVNQVVDVLAGSTASGVVIRNRRRAALYVMLSSHGYLRQFMDSDAWDRSDHGPVEFKRNLLGKIITFLV